MYDVAVRLSGPLFNGDAERELDRGTVAARHALAEEAERLVRGFFLGSIRHNRGHFMASITTIDSSRIFVSRSGRKTYTMPIVTDRSAETIVTTDLASYGPWLEGTGSRNQSTRFKGYHGFRRTAQALDRDAAQVAEAALEPYIKEMSN